MAHQERAIAWMLEQEASQDKQRASTKSGVFLPVGGVLADEPGLGKTLTTLCLILSGAVNQPTLIVSPTPVICAQWSSEIARFVSLDNPTKKVTVTQYTGPPFPYSFEAATKQIEELQGSTIILTDLGVVRKEYHFLEAQQSGR